MTFFYDLNKKLADLAVAGKEQLTEGKKPDFLDFDKDGDKKEPMKKALKDKEKKVTEGDFGPLEAAGDEPAEPDSEAIAKKKAREAARRRREEKAEADLDDLSKDIRTPGKKSASTKFVAGRAYGGAAQKDDEDEDETSKAASGPKKRGRPAGTKRSIGAKGPSSKSKLLAKGSIKEEEIDEEQLGELSPGTLGSYIKKSSTDAKFRGYDAGAKDWGGDEGDKHPSKKTWPGKADDAKAHKRLRGVEKAVNRLTKEECDEGSTGDYSAKKARAGKDIGKPGKAFAKIAKSAGEKYGSKERGEKVAGAVLAKLRGKTESVDEGASDDCKAAIALLKKNGYKVSKAEQELDEISKGTAKSYISKKMDKIYSADKAPGKTKAKRDVQSLQRAHERVVGNKPTSEKELDEKAVSKKQQKFMGMVHAAQKGEKAASPEVAKVAKEMPKKAAKDFAATKHKGLPEKVKSKKKEEEVEESGTVAGSVAPAATGGKKSAGGFTFGKGIYDSYNREVESMISESININASTSSDGMKSLSVTATDEDVMKLAEILKMAGLGGAASGPSSCPTCEQAPCACAEMVDENSPDWPTNTETSDDALQYAGGLNKPKSTGQTTAPVVNRDPARGSVGPVIEDELSKMMEMAGIQEAKAKPDYIDLDKDGDKKESMKKAAKDKAEKVEESFLSKLWKEFKAQ